MSKNQHQNVETHEELSEVLKVAPWEFYYFSDISVSYIIQYAIQHIM